MKDDIIDRLARIETKLDTLIGENGRIGRIERTLRLHDKVIWSCTGADAALGYLLKSYIGQ